MCKYNAVPVVDMRYVMQIPWDNILFKSARHHSTENVLSSIFDAAGKLMHLKLF